MTGLEESNRSDLEAIPVGFGGHIGQTGDHEGLEGKSSGSVTATASDSQEQMEKEVLIAWNYYLDAFNKEEILSPSLKRIGLAILSKLNPAANRVEAMAGAIDVARHIVKREPAKAYFAAWPKIFGKFSTFKSLYEQWLRTDVPDAAELPEEFLSPKTTSPSTA